MSDERAARRRPVPWSPLEALPVALLFIVLSAVLTGIAALVIADDDALTAVILVLSEGAMAVTVLAWVRARHGAGAGALALRAPDAADAANGTLTGAFGLVLSQFVVAPVVVWLVETVRGRDVTFPDQLDLADPGAGVLALTGFAVIVVAPLAEEIFFRGFLYRSLRDRIGLGPAAVVSSALFAVAHIRPIIMPSIFVLGLVLSWSLERRDSLATCVVAHGLFNTVGYALYVAST